MSTTNPYTEKLYLLYQQFPVVTTDSRKIPSKSMFFALKGDNFDGNQFAGQALEEGAAVAVVDDRSVIQDRRYILVDDVLQNLQQLAMHHRQQLDIPVIGITGSNGKTTTKELIHAVLSTRYNALSTEGNLNNHIGVPLTLLAIQPETEIAVIEMGANHQGEIAFLCELAKPTHGLITNIGRAHLEGFGGFDGVVRAKTELYTYLKRHDGEVFLNIEDTLLTKHAVGIPTVTYGFGAAGTSGKVITEKKFHVSVNPAKENKLFSGSEKQPGDSMRFPGTEKLVMEITFPDDQKQLIQSSLFGSYNSLNIVAAASVGFQFEVPAGDISRAIDAYTPSNNRSQLHKTSLNLLVLDAYNANPSSMTAALADFDSSFTSDKIVILGDMLELGAEEEEEHMAILEMLKNLDLQQVFLVGPLFSKLNNNAEWISFKTSQEAKEWFANNPIEHANIMLKGSRGIRLEEIVECL